MFFDAAARGERMAFADWGPKAVGGVPFTVTDPQGDRVKNVVMLHSPNGTFPPDMPKAVTVPCNTAVKAVHVLGGVGGWAAQKPVKDGTVSLIVRLHYADGTSEDHPLRNGEHVADYVRRLDVPGSAFAFELEGGKQVRYLAIAPKRPDVVKAIEFVKGADKTAPVVMAVTVETP